MAALRKFLQLAAISAFGAVALLAPAQPAMVLGEPARAEKEAPEARLRLAGKVFERRVKLAPVDASAIERVRAANQRTRAGANVQLKRAAIGVTRGLEAHAAAEARALDWTPVGEGMAARFSITSPEASAVRVALDLRNVAPQMEMVFFGSQTPDHLFGPYRVAEVVERSAPWWSPLTEGETLIVEYFLPRGAAAGAEPSLADVGHLFVSPAERLADKRGIDIGTAGACNVDLECSALNASTAFRNLAQSVAQMVYNDGGTTYLCTGTLLNDADPSTQHPYFFSANHCFDDNSPPYKSPAEMQAVANTLTTLWFFEATSCNSKTANPSWQQIAGGATVLYNSPSADALFLRLNRDPPSGAFFLGWDANAISAGSAVVAVHHPQGDLKKVSQGTALGFSRWDSTTPSNSYIQVRWSSGTTEGGSSGSGIFTFAGGQYLLRGGLRGGDAWCSNPQGTDLYSRFDQVYPSVSQYLGASTSAPDMHQPGLDGMWYEPATSGQGFALQIVPNVGAGRGYLQGGWFTFDTSQGGLDRQRWYSLGGDVFTGSSSASLTIYQNTGGTFSAPPPTTAVAVGSATLSFSSCTAGQLNYSFSDGRSGAIPLTRLLPNITCSTSSTRPTNADFALSGNWYDPNTAGQGLIIEMNPSSPQAFVTWYTYAVGGQLAGVAGQRWYTAQNAYSPGTRSVGLTLYETTGGVFDNSAPSSQATIAVGTAALIFSSCTSASFSYNFTNGANAGRSGTLSLTRIGGAGAGCTP